jgi:hypothetical protein
MALEDGLVLAECLASGRGIAQTVESFEARRRPRTQWVLDQTPPPRSHSQPAARPSQPSTAQMGTEHPSPALRGHGGSARERRRGGFGAIGGARRTSALSRRARPSDRARARNTRCHFAERRSGCRGTVNCRSPSWPPDSRPPGRRARRSTEALDPGFRSYGGEAAADVMVLAKQARLRGPGVVNRRGSSIVSRRCGGSGRSVRGSWAALLDGST